MEYNNVLKAPINKIYIIIPKDNYFGHTFFILSWHLNDSKHTFLSVKKRQSRQKHHPKGFINPGCLNTSILLTMRCRWERSSPPSCTTSCATAAVWGAWTDGPSSSSSPWRRESTSYMHHSFIGFQFTQSKKKNLHYFLSLVVWNKFKVCYFESKAKLFSPLAAVRFWAGGRLKGGYVRVRAATARRTKTTSGSSRRWTTAWPRTETPTNAVSSIYSAYTL